MKNILLAGTLLVFALCFNGCDSKQKESNATAQKATSTIKVGTSAAYYPFTFVENDTLQGFEIDVWRAIAKEMGLEVEFLTGKFSGLFGMLETDKIDTISNQITITEKRAQKYNFSLPYVYDGVFIITHVDNNSINSLDDLAGKKVGVSLGSNYEQLLKKLDIKSVINIIPYDGEGHKQDTILKRIDAYVEDKTSAIEAIKKYNLPLKPVGKSLNPLKNAFPFMKNQRGDTLLKGVDKAILTLRENGTLKSISQKWFNFDITSE